MKNRERLGISFRAYLLLLEETSRWFNLLSSERDAKIYKTARRSNFIEQKDG